MPLSLEYHLAFFLDFPLYNSSFAFTHTEFRDSQLSLRMDHASGPATQLHVRWTSPSWHSRPRQTLKGTSNMRVFDLLSLLNPSIRPEEAKVHLATWNGEDNPIDVYLAGEFDEWQCWQTRRNFERKFVVSLISLPGPDRWLFAGVHNSTTPEWLEDHKLYRYALTEDQSCKEMNGRLVASFHRPGRQSYLNAENWSQKIFLSEVFSESLSIGEFPGFKGVNLTKDELEMIFRQSLQSWRTALSSVAGVYLISDTASGKVYVGSASGEGGIWQRWACYADDGHGGNVELRKLLTEAGAERAKKFRYSILEIADVHASLQDILARESHWKDVLMSRTHGLNAN